MVRMLQSRDRETLQCPAVNVNNSRSPKRSFVDGGCFCSVRTLRVTEEFFIVYLTAEATLEGAFVGND